MTVYINGTTGYSGPVGVLGDLTTTGNTILGDQSTDTLNVANGNLVLNSSGNLGLGVTPAAWLSSIKVMQVGTTGALWASGGITFLTNNTFTDGTDKYLTTAAATRYYQSAGSHIWNTAASGTAGNAVTFTQTMTLNASGQLGIGATSPATNLHIGSGTGNNLGVLLSRGVTTNFYEAYDGTKTFIGGVDNTLSYAKVGTLSGHDLAIITGNGSKIYCVNSTGNVGIGTSTPPMILGLSTAGSVISGTATIGSNMQGIQVYNTNSAITNNAVGIWFPTGPHQAGIASFRGNADTGWDTTLAFYTHGAATNQLNDCFERMRIDGEGNLLLGTTIAPSGPPVGPSIFTSSLFVNQSGTVINNSSVVNLQHSGGSYYGIMLKNGSTGTSNALTFINSSNSVIGSVVVTTTATSYGTSSDYRLKNTISPMTGALAKVALLKPCTYKWNADGSDSQGFIAHELAEVIPQAVSGEKDAVNEDGSIKPQGIDTSFLVATLTAAIQELKAELDSVKSELATIKGAA
jgi:hypothetical protein